MKKYNWVAQDEDGCIYLYDKKPEHSDTGKWWRVSVPNSDISKIFKGARITNWKESLIDLSKNDYIIKDGILMATRKHASLIHAWADGAEIQFKDYEGDWVDCSYYTPGWDADTEYRIKPNTKTVKFRNYLHKGTVGLAIFGSTPMPKEYEWLGDWQEVEIEL